MDWAKPSSQPYEDAQPQPQQQHLMSQLWAGLGSAPIRRLPLEDVCVEWASAGTEQLALNQWDIPVGDHDFHGSILPSFNHQWANTLPEVNLSQQSQLLDLGQAFRSSHGVHDLLLPITKESDNQQRTRSPEAFEDLAFVPDKSWSPPIYHPAQSANCFADLWESNLMGDQLSTNPAEMGNQQDSPNISKEKVEVEAPSKAPTKISTSRQQNERAQQGSLPCDYPECHVKFTHKKDRSRHIRTKHQLNQGFICPIIDCTMGTGHKIHRRDKIRDHLTRKSDHTAIWKCFLPNCVATAPGRVGMMDHLGEHSRMVRLASQQLLIDYGFISGDIFQGTYYDKPPLGYLTCEYMCRIPGCPFGTSSREAMTLHLAILHVGPTCPCPMPGCEAAFSDWNATAGHLARSHDAAMRKTHDKDLLDQGFWWRSSIFVCPICKVEIKILLNKASCDEKIRTHCKNHSLENLQRVSSGLVSAFVLSNRRRLWYPIMPLLEGNDEQVFAYLTWPKEDLLKIWTMS